MVRSAFSMIELIISLVVMGFVLISVPLIMTTAQKTTEGNIIQEAIFASATKINQILSYSWDENTTNISGSSFSYGKVLDTGGSGDMVRTGGPYRLGHFTQSEHRRFYSTLTNASSLGDDDSNSSTFNDIDDFIATNINLFINTDTEATGYKKNYLLDIDVAYVDDETAVDGSTIDYTLAKPFQSSPFLFNGSAAITAKTTNIKRIIVSVKEDLGAGKTEPISSLVFFSSNIGEIDYHSREY